jgi:hypothetical protein
MRAKNAAWRKSSFSSASSNCVEVSFTASVVAARDSKNTDGPVLAFAPTHWLAFLRDAVN